MTEQLKIIISAEIDKLKSAVDEAQGKIDELASSDSKLSKLNEGFSKVGDVAKKGLAVAAGAIAGVGAALLGSVGATEEYRVAQEKLVTAFEAAGGSAETAKGVYNDLYRVLGDGDVAVEAANHLAKLTTEEKALSEWTEICQGVYATFGDSLPIEGLTEAINHTTKLGEVQGPLADALEWSGVSTEAFNEQLAACVTEEERSKLIRDTLNGLYGEAASLYEENAAAILAQNEAEAKMAENMARIGEAMQPVQTMLTELGATLMEEIAPIVEDFVAEHGPAIKDALSGIATKIGDALSWLIDNWETVSTIGTIVLAIAAALAVLSTGLSVYSTVIGVASAVSLPVVGIIAAIVAGIAALVAIIVVCVKNWDDITAAVQNFANKVGEFFTGLWDSITGWLSDMTGKISGWWKDTKEGWSNFWNGVGDKISAGVENAKNNFNEMKEAVVNRCAELKENATNRFNEIKDNISTRADEIKSNVSTRFSEIKETMGTVMEAARSTVQEKLDNIKRAYEENGGGVKGIASAAMEAVKGYYSAGYTFIDNLTGGKLSAIKDKFSNVMGNIKSTVSDTFENLKNSISSKLESAKNTVSSIIDKIKGFFNFKITWPKIPMPHFSISPSGWKIGDLLKGSIPKLSISWYQKGGVFDSPTLFGYGNGIGGLGENGAEAIVPLEKNTYWLDRLADMLNEKMNTNVPIVLQVDGKVFAQTAISTMNDYKKQTGSLPLLV